MARATELIANDLAALVPSGGIIVAMTDEGADPRYAAVRSSAAAIAALAPARIVLFYAPIGQVDPTARRWRLFEHAPRPEGDAERAPGSSPRRDALRRQAGVIRALGVEVAVWVTDRPSAAGLAEAVSELHADLVLMPAEPERPGVVRRTLGYRAARVGVPVIAVDARGGLVPVQPFGAERGHGDTSVQPRPLIVDERQRLHVRG